MSAVLNPMNEPFAGQILDVDGHMYMEPQVLREMLDGLEHGGGFVLDFLERFTGSEQDRKFRAKNRDNVLAIKGISALGSYDPIERVEAFDRVGIRAQITFVNTVKLESRQNTDIARTVCRRINDYGLDWQKKTGNRARFAPQINMGKVDWAIEELERVIRKGALVVDLPCAQPPAGVSPAHEVWDPFWARIQEADIAAVIHLGDAGLPYSKAPLDPMLPLQGWGDAAALRLKPAERSGGEEAVSPYYMLVAHMGAEVYLQVMVMGGVFERFPRLRFGILEFSTGWIGPAVERMDTWAEFLAKAGKKYDLKPSEFVKRNVRAGPFPTEDFPLIVERYGLKEIFCFSTDYGHLEGSRDPIGKFREMCNKIEPGYDRAFFVDNPSWLFPQL
jgi:predicted TIM-barrel fold metal-dependent hydrolase